MRISSTEELVLAAKQGNKEAFGELYLRFRDYVEAAVRKTLGATRFDVDNIVSETFLVAYERISQLRSPSFFKSWIWKIARNKALNSFRRVRETPVASDSLVWTEVASSDGERDEGDLREAILEELAPGIDSLKEIYRDAIVLFYLRELSCKEASRRLDVKEGTFKRRLHHGRNELRKYYGLPAA